MFRADRRVLITAALALLQVIVLVIAVAAVMLGYGDGRARTPHAAVEGYLRALADGDASGARQLMVTPPDYRLLTEDALEQARELAPVGDIEVSAVADTEGEVAVPATYTIGGRAAEVVLAAVERGDRWLVVDGVATVDVSDLGVEVPGLTVFGEPVAERATEGLLYLFPGPIAWGSTARYLGVSAAEFPLAPGPPWRPQLTIVLDEEGREAVSAAVGEYLTGCAGSEEAVAARDRPGCRQVLFARAEPGSVEWEVPEDLSGLTFTVDQGNPDRVSVAGSVTWGVQYIPVEDGLTTDSYTGYLRGTVDLAAEPLHYQP